MRVHRNATAGKRLREGDGPGPTSPETGLVRLVESLRGCSVPFTVLVSPVFPFAVVFVQSAGTLAAGGSHAIQINHCLVTGLVTMAQIVFTLQIIIELFYFVPYRLFTLLEPL